MQHFVGVKKSPQQYGGTEQLGFIAQCKHVSISTVHKLQKQAAQVILDTGSWERSTKLFKELNWLPLDDDTKIQ